MKRVLNDIKVNVKLKLAALWSSLMFLYIYADYFDLKTPGTIENIINLKTPVGPTTPKLLVIFSIILIIPSLMICLSVLLKPIVNKWLNIVTAVLWSTMSFLIIIQILRVGNQWYAFYGLYQLVEIIVLAVIVWTAWNWPKQSLKPPITEAKLN